MIHRIYHMLVVKSAFYFPEIKGVIYGDEISLIKFIKALIILIILLLLNLMMIIMVYLLLGMNRMKKI